MQDDQRLGVLGTAILFFVLVSLGPLLYLHNTWLAEIEDQSRVQDHLGQAREDFAKAHLWFEELLTGDPNIRPEKVWGLFASARGSLKAFRSDQIELDPLVLEFVSSDGAKIDGLVNELLEKATALENLARTRSGNPSLSSAGTVIDEEFDVLFTETLAASFGVERAVREFSLERMADRREIHWLTLGLWGAGALGTGLSLIHI